MPHTRTASIQDSEIDHPLCPECGSTMWLARLSVDGAGRELRKFECPVCEVSTRSADEIERRAAIRF
jgi:hypothetical protein